jgi:hypothetical protein
MGPHLDNRIIPACDLATNDVGERAGAESQAGCPLVDNGYRPKDSRNLLRRPIGRLGTCKLTASSDPAFLKVEALFKAKGARPKVTCLTTNMLLLPTRSFVCALQAA